MNLRRDPQVTVEIGDDRFEATAAATSGERRERVWTMLKERCPFFADHEAKTSRTIPVVALVRHRDPAASQ